MPQSATNRPSLRGPLQSRNFRLLVACNVISVTGSAVSFVALPFAVLKIGGSASDVGYVATAKLVPLIAFLLLGGVIADRLPRHKVMAAANVLQALAQGASATLLLTGHARIWELVVLAAAGGVGVGFYYPAAQGLLPQTVPPEQRPRANALDQTGQGAASIAGSAAGGLLIGLAGPGWSLAIDAATFAVAAALRTGMHFPAMPLVRASGLIHDLREGWQEFTARRWQVSSAKTVIVIPGQVNAEGRGITRVTCAPPSASTWASSRRRSPTPPRCSSTAKGPLKMLILTGRPPCVPPPPTAAGPRARCRRRAREIISAVAERGVPEAAELAEAYRAACSEDGPPALP